LHQGRHHPRVRVHIEMKIGNATDKEALSGSNGNSQITELV
jgi:hypothetical protein